jgi:hypothetical protein
MSLLAIDPARLARQIGAKVHCRGYRSYQEDDLSNP